MSETKYTQGEWQVDHEAEGVCAINAEMGKTWKHIAIVTANGDGSTEVTDEEAEANARLLAAAPDLLATCEELVADLISHAKFGLNETEVAMLKRAEAAIAKARGE